MSEEQPIKSSEIILRKLDGSIDVSSFDCGIAELNGFLQENALNDLEKRMNVTFVLLHKNRILAYYCVLADRIDTKVDPIRRSVRNRLKKKSDYRYTSFPSIKIGRLAVDKDFQSANHCEVHLGKLIINGLKYQYATMGQFGCRYLTVDAMNNERTIHFYQDNGFVPMIATPSDNPEDTIPMLFDLASVSM
ncbi:MAG: hypothetical protein MJZ84_05990 [Paludibacteraceae bacterium]|nr:hypothetical protein [Paludibacteraceae bacterium]